MCKHWFAQQSHHGAFAEAAALLHQAMHSPAHTKRFLKYLPVPPQTHVQSHFRAHEPYLQDFQSTIYVSFYLVLETILKKNWMA